MSLPLRRFVNVCAVLAATVLVGLATTNTASAQTPVFGNVRTQENGGQVIGPTSGLDIVLSSRFITGANSVTIASLLVTVNGFNNLGSTGFGIYSNNGSNNPGSLLFNFGTQSFSDATQTLTYTPGGTFVLQANTVYHLRNLSSVETAWRYGTPAAGTPFASNGSGITHQAVLRSLNGGTSYSSHPSQPHFVLFAPGSVTAPEPSALALLLLPMAGGVARVARRRK